MKLLIVASLTKTTTANYFITALQAAGHELLVCSDIPGPRVDVKVQGLFDVEAIIRKNSFTAQAILFFEGGSMRLLPDTSRVKSCVTAWYAIDTHMDFEKHVRIGRLFDITFVAQKQYVTELTSRGVPQVYWMPLAFATELAPTQKEKREVDVAYVGSENVTMHPQRSALLDILRNESLVTQFGRASPEEMGRIYANAKLVFNRSVNNDVNMRFFEAMGSGAVLLTDCISNNGVEDLFEEGRHYITYRSEQELLEVTRELLSDPIRVREIGDAARAYVLAEHTYVHRAVWLIEQLERLTRKAMPAPPDIFAACLALGLTADALHTASVSVSNVRGGRLQSAMGKSAGLWIDLAALVASGVEKLRRALPNGIDA